MRNRGKIKSNHNAGTSVCNDFIHTYRFHKIFRYKHILWVSIEHVHLFHIPLSQLKSFSKSTAFSDLKQRWYQNKRLPIPSGTSIFVVLWWRRKGQKNVYLHTFNNFGYKKVKVVLWWHDAQKSLYYRMCTAWSPAKCETQICNVAGNLRQLYNYYI